jgi:hypothetical protein
VKRYGSSIFIVQTCKSVENFKESILKSLRNFKASFKSEQ